MMKQYNITVNGVAYAVTVEPIDSNGPAQVASSTAPAVPAQAPSSSAAPAAPCASTGQSVYAPMPGVIHDIAAAVGQQVKTGDLLFILEAMKMENELYAPCGGVVTQIAVSKGTTVNTDDLLCVIQ